MGTSHLNVWLRDHNCTLFNSCWMLDLAVQLCNGATLYDLFPLVEQLKERYSKPATVTEYTDYSAIGNQDGKSLEVTVNGGVMQQLYFTPTSTLKDIFDQMKSYFSGVTVTLKDGHITITTDSAGWDSSLVIGGTCDLAWAGAEQGSGYKISTRWYRNAYRINFRPKSGEFINHVEMDVPTGCYKIFARACHRNNEDTSTVMKVIDTCGTCHTVDLLLPEFRQCAGGIIHPFMERVVNDYQVLVKEDADKILVFAAAAMAANLSREQIQVELAERRQDAIDMGLTDLVPRIDAVIAIANQLPQCYC